MAEARGPSGPRSRRTIAVLTAIVVVGLLVALLAWASSRGDEAAPPVDTTPTTVPARPASMTTLGLDGWTVQSTAVATAPPEVVSTAGYSTAGWLAVKPDDAGAPGTEIGALVQNGRCPDLYVSTNLGNCRNGPGGAAGGDPTIPAFDVPWWFRTEFTPDLAPGEHADLVVNGIVGAADVWVNGTKVADRSTVQGSFARVDLDVTLLLHDGVNVLALAVATNDPQTMLTVSTVDWTQPSPDSQTGIQFPVQLHRSRPVALADVHVNQDDAADLSRAALTVKALATNHDSSPRSASVTATVTPPGDGPPIEVHRDVELGAGETQEVTFSPTDSPGLELDRPAVWWPRGLGDQPLYRLTTTVDVDGAPSDQSESTFGIRTVTSSLTAPSTLAPEGSRRFAINGVPLVIRGAGWTEDLLLRYSTADTATQVALVEGLGINTVRTEGHEMPDDFYDRMDRAGILINAGYQCCAGGWDRSPGDPPLDAVQQASLGRTALNIGQRLRNRPSVFTYGWSDLAPSVEQESISLDAFRAADFSVPMIASAEYRSTPTLGPSGEREGPYLWVPPLYWYDKSHGGDPALADVDPLGDAGGAWGFVSESGAGHSIPTLDSIRRFLSPAEQDALWQSPTTAQYHTTFNPPDDPSRLASLTDLDAAIEARLGPWSSLEQYVQLAQVQNYEDSRAQFEAFIAHAGDAVDPSTGTIYWQLNKGWPTLLWALYNNDYDLPGSYFGAQTANRPVHVLFAEDTRSVTVDNLTGTAQTGLRVEAKVYDLAGRVLDDQVLDGVDLASQEVRSAVLTPKLPAATRGEPPRTSFVELTVTRDGQPVDRNVYWQSTQPDAIDWSQTSGAVAATMTRYADLKDLRSLAPAQVGLKASSHDADDGSGDVITDVTVTNTSTTPTVGFFLRLDVRSGDAGGDPVAPVIWSGNDLTLWPGQSQVVTARYHRDDLHGASPIVTLSGWNVAPVTAAA